MVKNIEKNRIENGNLTNGATNGAQNQINNDYAEELRERKQEAINGAASAARDIEGVWGVQWATMAGKISKAMRSKSTGCGVIDCGYAKIDGAGGDNIVYVTVNYSRKRDADGIVSCVITLAAKASSRADAQYIELPLVYSATTKNEDKFTGTLGAVMIKAILAAYDDDDEIARMTSVLRENDRKAADHDAYWAEQTNCARETTSDMLDECGYNALALAKALVCAEKELEHRYCGDAKAVEDVWRACRDEILRRLASLGDGGGDPAPGCDDNNGNPAPGFDGDGGNSNDNSGNPAPCLDDEYPNAGDVYATQTDGVNVMVTGGYFDEIGDWIVTGKLVGKNGPERDLYEVCGMLYYTDDNGFSYRLKRRVDEAKTNSGKPAYGLTDEYPLNGLKRGDTVQSSTGEVYVYIGRTCNGVMLLRDNGGDGVYAAVRRNGRWIIEWNDMDEVLELQEAANNRVE